MAKEWVKDARNEARVESNLHAEIDRALGVAKKKNQELTTQLIAKEQACRSVEASLENAQDQTEDQHKKLYYTEIELATQKQLVLELKADLQKAKEAARTAKEAAEASEQASYDRGVQETEIRLANELVEVCRDYCKEVWAKALNQARVPAASEQRLVENIFFTEDIREVPVVLPSLTVLALPPSEHPSTTQASLPPSEVFKGLDKAGN